MCHTTNKNNKILIISQNGGLMVDKKNFLSLAIVFTCLFAGSTRVQAMHGYIKFPLAVVQGAVAAACLITARDCVRACLDTKLTLPPLAAGSPALAAQQSMRAKVAFWATETICNAGLTVARTAEFVFQKAATLSSGVAVGALGVYLAVGCLRTLAR